MFTLFHIVAGSAGLLSGAIALCARKGRGAHATWGSVYGCSMIAMSFSGATIAAVQGEIRSVFGGALAFHLVATGWLTLREAATPRWWLPTLAVLALALAVAGLLSVAIDVAAVREDRAIVVVFGGILAMSALADLYRHRVAPAAGRQRVLRHLWRMSFAMLLACAAFFLGQADEFPPALRRTELLVLPCFAVLAALAYWAVRIAWPPRHRDAHRVRQAYGAARVALETPGLDAGPALARSPQRKNREPASQSASG